MLPPSCGEAFDMLTADVDDEDSLGRVSFACA
jgi:hypothetical protein